MVTKVEERVGIPVSQERVWEVLADLENWGDWNPLHPKVEGKLSIGAPIRLEQHLEGQPPGLFDGRVNDWIPYEQIHIGRQLARGWAHSVRYIEIEPLGDGSIFSVGELFGGLLGDMVAKRERRALRAGFLAMGEALRDHIAKLDAAPASTAEATPAAKPKATRAKAKPAATEAPAAPVAPHKKTVLKPIPLQSYAPKPLGMKMLGGVQAPEKKK